MPAVPTPHLLHTARRHQVLLLVTHLTYTVINVMKRLAIILAGTALSTRGGFGGFFNTLGVVLAVSGILAYNVVKDAGACAGV